MQKVVPDSKLFNHRRYDFYEGYSTKAEAQSVAKRQRAMGYQVRIITIPHIRGYFLYERGLRTKGLKGL